MIPDKATRGYDMKKVVMTIADNNEIFEPHELWAKNMLVAFIRIMGQPVGVIANNPKFGAGVLDVNASDKASRFIRFCDAFNIPLLTFADVPGYMPGTNQEWSGIISHGAKLLHAYSEATVPKITVVTRKDYGGAYIGMCSKYLGADYVMAWPSAEIAVVKFPPRRILLPDVENWSHYMKLSSTIPTSRPAWASLKKLLPRGIPGSGWLFFSMH